ncbi:prepilin-type N-terminal cleavage/methylation domain-containing protein [Clostridium sp. AM58-1XD]|uniref:type II secretion system protein n=1 Tax=Clostridium sp. AM58-1XD TaxID=2292307 RepID=UPI000E553B2E|nr:prepilin-type N-terminal cleavage/methylation domain-containing protein [Clostridium sp. AM58-1XD]RGZ00163.1 prepilin-type N-terminal cleavage/methylation domain-containing protein [Clostridium sp. AM58-1XD]
MKKNNKGFSLIELIIAVAILVVLSGLLAPQLIKYVERSREAKDMQTLDSVYVAVNTALTNEKAYDKFITDHTGTTTKLAANDDILDSSKTDAFSKEVQSILGKNKVELVSKRAKAKSGVVRVEVNTVTSGADGVSGLEVGVYAGTEGNYNDGFLVGHVTATKNTTTE